MIHDAKDVANQLISYASLEGTHLTPMQVQKLAYFLSCLDARTFMADHW